MLRRVTSLLRPVATKRATKTTGLFSVRSNRAKTHASNLTQTRTFLGLFNNNKKIEVCIVVILTVISTNGSNYSTIVFLFNITLKYFFSLLVRLFY